MNRHSGRMFSAAGSIQGLRLLLVVLVLLSVNHPSSATDRPSSAALIRIPSSIVLDGRLDEPEWRDAPVLRRSEEHTSELQSRGHLVCRLLLEKKKQNSQ